MTCLVSVWFLQDKVQRNIRDWCCCRSCLFSKKLWCSASLHLQEHPKRTSHVLLNLSLSDASSSTTTKTSHCLRTSDIRVISRCSSHKHPDDEVNVLEINSFNIESNCFDWCDTLIQLEFEQDGCLLWNIKTNNQNLCLTHLKLFVQKSFHFISCFDFILIWFHIGFVNGFFFQEVSGSETNRE